MRLLKLFLVVLGLVGQFNVQASSKKSFAESKKLLKAQHTSGGKSFYCGEKFNSKFEFRRFQEYRPSANYVKLPHMVEWGHIVSTENFGRHFKMWRKGHRKCVRSKGRRYKGRKCAKKVSAKFRKMEADRINIVPAIGQVNALRSKYNYFEIAGEKRAYGGCDIEIKGRKMEPPENRKGDVARVYRYMAEKYEIEIISKEAKMVFDRWESLDPVSIDECRRVRKSQESLGIFEEICAGII
ncbi:MAG: endonuclease I [Bacteriovoracaceae bacterium]|nr:endonuclease I [Bacteriovoracaceae bacterium]